MAVQSDAMAPQTAPPPTLFFYHHPWTPWLSLAALSAVFLAIGAVIYLLGRYPHLRRAQYQGGMGCSHRMLIMVLVPLWVVSVLITARVHLTRFVALRVEDKSVVLDFAPPWSSISLPESMIENIRPGLGPKYGVNPVVVETSGFRWTGFPIRNSEFYSQRNEIMKRLGRE